MSEPVWRGDAVLFDLDGVLVDSLEASERVWLRWAERHGVERARLLATVHDGSARDSVAKLAPYLDAEAESARLEFEQVDDTEGVVALPGAAGLTAAIPAGRWAVVTSCTIPLAEARLAAAGLPRPRTLITIDGLECGKPAPEGYLAAASALSAEPSRCLVVENAPSGVAAGRAAGATVLGLLTSHSAAELSDAQIHGPHLGAFSLTSEEPLELSSAPRARAGSPA